ncbi:DUF2971 domain-containing protein [Enterobacter ludwigii]|uniref:DUF2971 domain-containing protein n=1 Tax=Enterobacter ludwigii TaxID=299767 RepID=UPI003F7211C8
MNDAYPNFIYKYRPIENYSNLENDWYLDALFNQYAIFSSRTNFNDLFDSKIDLIKPSPKDIKELSRYIPKTDRVKLLTHVKNGCFTAEGCEFITNINQTFNKLIDSYSFMSLSSVPDSNLLWSHYGSSHRGFCIEYRTEYVKARKVEYVNTIPSLELIDFYKVFFNLSTDNHLGYKILDALHCKLVEWLYESEYRFMADKRLTYLNNNEKFKKVSYDTDFIESIIFGYRMEEDVKKFIINNMPLKTKFKQATIGRNAMRIIDYSSNNTA